jgi:Zn-dependent protease/CBS domain-containing protein
MNGSIGVGRVGGIPLRANWTLVPVLALIAAALAGSLLPAAAPGERTWGYLLFGVFAALAFYGCLLVHELAHARAAVRHGLRVTTIVLWAAGGLAQLERDPASPRAEIELAAAGPLASVGLSAGLALLAWLVGALGSAKLLPVTLNWLAAMNALLALFNLLPAFPLDGGRILRALLWRRGGDRAAATAAAARVGQVGGVVLIALGVAVALTEATLVGAIWMIVLGWLLYLAATQERRGLPAPTPGAPSAGSVSTPPAGAAALPARAGEAMRAVASAVPATTPVAEVIQRRLLAAGATALPVVDAHGRLIGLATVERIAALGRDRWASTPIAAATAPLSAIVTCTPGEPLHEVARRLERCPEGRALVLDANRPAGVLSLREARQFLACS